MNKLFTGLCASTLALSFAVASFIPAEAAPVFIPKAETAAPASDVQNVQYDGRRHYDGRRNIRRSNRHDDGGFYNGYRGYRYHRPGYRRHGDFWFPAGAFIAGALITGAIVNSNNAHRSVGSAHVDWCYDHYRSYRVSDNTWKPSGAPRRHCNSPFD